MSILNLKDAVEKAINNQNWYAALALALALPDICGKLEGQANIQKRYIVWLDRYLSKNYNRVMSGKNVTFLTGADCYAIRCAFLHEGNDDITSQRSKEVLDKFIFAFTSSHHVLFENTILMLNVAEFCREICEGVEVWYGDVKSNSDIKNRIDNMMQIKTERFSPIPGTSIH